MIILADLPTPTNYALAVWLVSAGASMLLINEGFKFFRNIMGKRGEPPNEQIHESYKQLAARVLKLEEKQESDRLNNEKHISERSGRIYSKVDDITAQLREEMEKQSDRRDEQIAELRTEVNGNLKEMRSEFSDRFDALPERLINMLKQTGAI